VIVSNSAATGFEENGHDTTVTTGLQGEQNGTWGSSRPNPSFVRVARDSLRAAATPSWQMYDTATNRLSGTANASVVRRELFANVDYFDSENCDSQSCKTTNAELSPGVIDGITKRLPSAETSNETTE